MRSNRPGRMLPYMLASLLPAAALADNILSTSSFQTCLESDKIKVDKVDVSYNADTRRLDFDVAGLSTEELKVQANLIVTAYGNEVYSQKFNPCDYDMPEMCPLPATTFASRGSLQVPPEYADKIPSIAFAVPDLDGNVRMELTEADGSNVACIESTIGNGKSIDTPAVSYAAGGIAAAALVMSAAGALAAGAKPGVATSSPSFTEVIHWFQGIAMNGMLSVQYPSVYRSFTNNFAFSTGLVPWASMQKSIDNFRASTGGSIDQDSYEYLKNNVTLVYRESGNSSSDIAKRALRAAMLYARDGAEVTLDGDTTSVGGDAEPSSSDDGDSGANKDMKFVEGIQAYSERLMVPDKNTFMTVLLCFAIVVAAIVILILLLKLILELWAMVGKLPKSMESWRARYWWRMAKAITNMIFLLYGIWAMYCVYQFAAGDSWGPKLLAGVTLALFTAVLAGFTWRIVSKARAFKKLEGDTSGLYENKETWVKYSLFYDSFKKDYWIFFVPVIIYMLAKGCIIAGASGQGLIQAGGQLIVEAIMLILLLWARPYQLKSSRWINIVIQVVRVLSVACILVFVEELGLSQTTKTVTGVVLIVVQSVLTGVLAILIAINAIIACVKENPHRKKRKEAEKRNRDLDNLTPLDARNSLLMESMSQKNTEYKSPGLVHSRTFSIDKKGGYNAVPNPNDRVQRFQRDPVAEDNDRLMSHAAAMGRHDRDASLSRSPPRYREPALPQFDFGSHAR